jgi:UDP-N-acetylmuramyl pentapeptide synthase
MQAAIENLAGMKAPLKVAIVGDMFELEEEAELEHRLLGKLLKEKKIDRVYLCGKLINAATREISEAKYFETREALIEELKRNPIPASTILIKASRGMGLEKIVEVLA